MFVRQYGLMYKLLFAFLLLTVAQTGKSQKYEQLMHRWKHASSDSEKVKAAIRLHEKYYVPYEDSIRASIALLEKAYRLANAIRFSTGMIYTSFYLGNHYVYENNTPVAIKYYLLSLKESEKKQGIYDIARARMGIGMVHLSLNNYPMAVRFFKSSLDLKRKMKEKKSISLQQYLLGFTYTAMKEYHLARLYLDSAIQIKKQLNDTNGLAECNLSLANILKGEHRYDAAVEMYDRLIAFYNNRKGEWYVLANIYCELADIQYSKGNLRKAEELALLAKNIADKVPNRLPGKNVSEILYKIYFAQGKNQKAFEYLNRYISLKDSIVNLDYVAQISVAEASYNFEKEQTALKVMQGKKETAYQLQLKLEHRKNTIYAILAILSGIVIIVIVIAYRWVSRQKQISDNLLLNILPKKTASELKSFGRALPKVHERVTIMFCDILSFTHIAEKLSPAQVVEMLDYYFKNFDTIVEQLGIEKIKTIGDAYMCAGGLERTDTNTEKMMVTAALKFHAFNRFVAQKMIDQYGVAFSFRIGIHTGSVVSGVVGRKKFTYDLWGDAVNVAARMEQNSVPGKINISGETYELIKDTYPCEYRGKIQAKNKGEIDMYFVNEP